MKAAAWRVLLLAVFIPIAASAQEVLIVGTPDTRVIFDATESSVEVVPLDRRYDARLEIAVEDGRFYWATREMKELEVVYDGPAYVIFAAVDGTGYIKMAKFWDENARAASERAQSLQGQPAEHDYMEHLVDLGLGAITYIGTASYATPR